MRQYKTVLLWVVLILLFVGFYQLFNHAQNESQVIDFTTFLDKADQKLVKSVDIKGDQYTGKLTDEHEFRTTGPDKADTALIADLRNHGVQVKFEGGENQSFLVTLLVQYLPLVFLILFFIFFMRQLQSGGGKAMSFGKSKAKLLSEHANKVTFSDVAGIDECKEELEEIIEFLKDPKKFTKLGGRIPKGVLLMGSPGTGKTLLAKAVAGEAGVPFFSISGSDFVEMFVGVGASRVRDLFEQGKKNAPCIIFIDEIDAVGRHRGAGLGGGHDEREQTLNQLLVEMDGFESNEGVILIAATNRPDVLDPALLRPGRFDRRIVVPRPDVRGRLGILAVHTRKVPMKEVDLDAIARGSPGFSGADLENLVNEAALLAARQNKEFVDMADFESAKDKVLMGTERKSMVMSEREKRTTAVHEAGHAIVARVVPGADPVHKVTIIPRGRALGLTQQLPAEDRLNLSKEFAVNQIAILMGGRIAEEIIFNQKTTGAGNDIERATELARQMVCEWGMSDKMGPLTFGRKEGEPFLGREMASGKDYSEATAIDIDKEVRELVTYNYDRAKKILLEHLPILKSMADALMEYETIDAADIDLIMDGKPLSKPKPAIKVSTAAPKAPEKKEKKKILDALEGLGKLGEPEKA
ncbi:MAG: ATP-dependent zinc metalloprotease FtsH [Deltaproteobacteria bacterium]|nr:ATP-dependent zinc metalloprotease FtsH [Deltaproteobacteria bacterium]